MEPIRQMTGKEEESIREVLSQLKKEKQIREGIEELAEGEGANQDGLGASKSGRSQPGEMWRGGSATEGRRASLEVGRQDLGVLELLKEPGR